MLAALMRGHSADVYYTPTSLSCPKAHHMTYHLLRILDYHKRNYFPKPKNIRFTAHYTVTGFRGFPLYEYKQEFVAFFLRRLLASSATVVHESSTLKSKNGAKPILRRLKQHQPPPPLRLHNEPTVVSCQNLHSF
jgi:hypothetical protein